MYKSVNDYISQGKLIKNADDSAIEQGKAWVIPTVLRTEHDKIHKKLDKAQMKAHSLDIQYTAAVNDKRKILSECKRARYNLIAYIVALHEKPRAEDIIILAGLRKRLPDREVNAVEDLGETINQWKKFDGTPDEFPIEYKEPFKAATKAYRKSIIDVQIAFGKKCGAYSKRDAILAEYAGIIKRVFKWLISKLPNGVFAKTLDSYGFDSREHPVYHKPVKVAISAEVLSESGDALQLPRSIETGVELPAVRINVEESPGRKRIKPPRKGELFFATARIEFQRATTPDNPNDNPIFVTIATIEQIELIDLAIERGKHYYYRARGRNRYHIGKWSAQVEVEITDDNGLNCEL